MNTKARIVRYKRVSNTNFIDFESALRSNSEFKDKDIDLFLQMFESRSLGHSLGDVVFHTLSGKGVPMREVAIQIATYLHNLYVEWFSKPYRLNLVNKLNEPVQYVWAYELHNGLILVDQSSYTPPGGTAVLTTSSTNPVVVCVQVKGYAISVWDQNDEEIGRISNLIVEQINEVEATKGTWRACEDTIEIG